MYVKNAKKSMEKAGWIDLGSDVNWVDYGGKWGKKAPDGSWYVVRFENLQEILREEGEEDECSVYLAEVHRIDLREVSEKNIVDALHSCGLYEVECFSPQREVVIVEALDGYGTYAPLAEFQGNGWPKSIRAKARRFAEEAMLDEEKLSKSLDRVVNGIGSTARDFGRGDPLAGMHNYLGEVLNGDREATDDKQNLMLKMHGVDVDKLKEGA